MNRKLLTCKKSKSILKTGTIVAVILLFPVLFTSCKKKEKAAASAALSEGNIIETKGKTHFWYYFTPEGFQKTDLPQNSSAMAEKPWTESIRICSTGVSSSENNQNFPEAYALVNRLGLLVFTETGPVLHSDVNLFDSNTASNLVMQDNTPFFSFFKNSFFNEKIPVNISSDSSLSSASGEKSISERPFLVRYDTNSGIFFPIINYENLQLEINDQITDFSWNGKQLNCSIKTTEGNNTETAKNKFSYFTVTPSVSLLSITPKTAPSTIFVGESNADKFRSSKRFEDFSKAPERLKKLLHNLPEDLPVLLEVSFSGNSFQTTYSQAVNNENPCLSAKAIIADTWALTVFEDGTCYFAGACFSRPVLAEGRTIAFRLPKLPEGFSYSNFALSGTMLYVAWEESAFYQTKRSGFISIDLDSVLYSKLRTNKN